MYYFQAILLACAAIFFTQRNGRMSGLVLSSIVVWLLGVSLIYWRYGPVGQWSFYQNDQYFHWRLVEYYVPTGFNLTFNRLNFLRLPYAGPAFLLAQVGINATLALKFVSLMCSVASFSILERFVESNHSSRLSLWGVWLSAAPITVFFSLLALRETMMILCVTYLFIGRSQAYKSYSLLALTLLRPHLAAAVAFGILWGWLAKHVPSRLHLLAVAATAIIPIYVGTIGFAVGNYVIYGLPLRLYDDLFQKDQTIQVFSAFVGLQFLTVAYQTVEYSTRSILLIRMIFPEIVFIPLLFSVSCLFFTPQFTRLKLSVLAAFVFFISVSSGTEYLSVRQSLPLMAVMGVTALISLAQIRKYSPTAFLLPKSIAAKDDERDAARSL